MRKFLISSLVILLLVGCTNKFEPKSCMKHKTDGTYRYLSNTIKDLVKCNFEQRETVYVIYYLSNHSNNAIFISGDDRRKAFKLNVSNDKLTGFDEKSQVLIDEINFESYLNFLRSKRKNSIVISHEQVYGLIKMKDDKVLYETVGKAHEVDEALLNKPGMKLIQSNLL